MIVRVSIVVATALLLSACASYPTPLSGGYSPITPHVAMQQDSTGVAVRWGGRIVQVEPRENETCFEMISTRLDSTGRPYWAADDTHGRFIACRRGFYDPAVFEPNREVTFTGRVESYEHRKIGEFNYMFPRVAADVVYLWPVRERVAASSPWPWWW